MYDVIFLATIIGFFLVCVGYIAICDRIIGPDSEFELEVVGDGDGDGDGAPARADVPEERAA